jgi:hypothetical protein
MIRLIYIAGSGRSGSTLLEQLLAQLPGFVAVGELRHLWRGDYQTTLCGCGQPFAACPFWQPLLTAVLAENGVIDFQSMLSLRNRVDRIRYLPFILTGWRLATYDRDYRRYVDILKAIYRQIAQQAENVYIVDSSKDISTLYLLARQPDIDLTVVHLVRDSRAVAYSWQRIRHQPQVTERTAYMPTYTAPYAAWDWLYRNLLTEWGRPLYASYCRLRYEDLVQNPAVMMGQLATQLATAAGLTRPNLHFIEQELVQLDRSVHSAWGNPMRFQNGRLTLKLDSAWQHKMSRRDKNIVTALTWPLLRRYDYI